MKEMKSEIKEIRTINGELIDFVWRLDDHTPIEIFYRDGSREIDCTPFQLKEPAMFYTNRAAVVHRAWREKIEKKREFMNRFERVYLLKFPRKYYERKIALTMQERNQENKRFSINTESIKENYEIIQFTMPSMCTASFSVEKEWLQKKTGWSHRVKINAEILRDGEIQKST
jgi:hypothetical protein